MTVHANKSRNSLAVERESELAVQLPMPTWSWKLRGSGRQRIVSVSFPDQPAPMVFQVKFPIDTDVSSLECRYKGTSFMLRLRRPDIAELEKICHAKQIESEGACVLRAPMPGNVLSVGVREGSLVEKDQDLAVLEAMKMQNIIRAPLSGTVSKVHCRPGDVVSADSPLIEIEQK